MDLGSVPELNTDGFRIALFGELEIRRRSGEVVHLQGRKAKALLGLLARRPGQITNRERACSLLWGDRGDAQARGSLRQALVTLRRALSRGSRGALKSDRDNIWLESSLVEVDVCQLERAVEGTVGTANLEDAVRLYRGTFLSGLELREPAFETWIETERRYFQDLACNALRSLIDQLESEGQPSRAIAAAKRLIALDSCDETGHRALMRLHAAGGNVSLAIRQYQICRETLSAGLGVLPSGATEQLRVRLQAGEVVPTSHGASHSDRPSLAVLRFKSFDPDSSQQYFAEGFAEDLRTELSRVRQLQVRAWIPEERGSAQADYVLEGSLRRNGGRLRIAVQLVNGNDQLWAEHFDRDVSEIFELQDDIVQRIAATLVGRIDAFRLDSARRKPTANLAAYECVLRGNSIPIGIPTAEAEARQLFERAIALDPSYARAHARLAHLLRQEWYRDLGGANALLERAVEHARNAVNLDDQDNVCHDILGWIHLHRKEFELALFHKEKAATLAPNSPEQAACMGVTHTFLGNADQALRCFERALELDPFFEPAWYWRMKGIAHFIRMEYDLAIVTLARSPNVPIWVEAYLAACHALTGRLARAEEFADKVLAREPSFSAHALVAKEPFRRQEHRDRLQTGLLRAGLPA